MHFKNCPNKTNKTLPTIHLSRLLLCLVPPQQGASGGGPAKRSTTTLLRWGSSTSNGKCKESKQLRTCICFFFDGFVVVCGWFGDVLGAVLEWFWHVSGCGDVFGMFWDGFVFEGYAASYGLMFVLPKREWITTVTNVLGFESLSLFRRPFISSPKVSLKFLGAKLQLRVPYWNQCTKALTNGLQMEFFLGSWLFRFSICKF